jgi:ATP-dependent DNA ligase
LPFALTQEGAIKTRIHLLFETIQCMEGIIAKRKGSIYRPGKHTLDWLKITCGK